MPPAIMEASDRQSVACWVKEPTRPSTWDCRGVVAKEEFKGARESRLPFPRNVFGEVMGFIINVVNPKAYRCSLGKVVRNLGEIFIQGWKVNFLKNNNLQATFS